MIKWILTVVLVLALAGLAALAQKWLPPFLKFVGTNSELIQGLADFVQLILWAFTALMAVLGIRRVMRERHQSKSSTQDNSIMIGGSVSGGAIVSGSKNVIVKESFVGGDVVGRDKSEDKSTTNIIIDPNYFKEQAGTHTPTFDYETCSSAHWGDLDNEAIKRFLQLKFVREQQDFNAALTPKEQFQRFQFAGEKGRPTYGAILCFGEFPNSFLAGCATYCYYWRDPERLSGFHDSQSFQGNLLSQLEGAMSFLQKHLNLERLIEADQRIERFDLPLEAAQEAIANALVHREYRNRYDPITINLFEDRLEVISPGTLPPPLTLEQLGVAPGTYPRNPLIARVFYLYRLVEHAGTGITRMRAAMKSRRLSEPEFNEIVGKFQVTLRRKRLSIAPHAPHLVIGREEALADLKQLFGITASEQKPVAKHSIIVMRGWPGVGKTTLAAALAHDVDMVKAFPDGILWASLGQTPNLLSEMTAWVRVLGAGDFLRPITLQEATAQLAALLRHKRILLILDDVWEAEHAAPFEQTRGNDCALLITTRELAVANAIAPTPEAVYNLSVLTEANALKLLRTLAPAVVAQYSNESLALVRALEYLPLAIQVASRMLSVETRMGWSVTELLAELREGTKILHAKAPTDRVDYQTQAIPVVAVLLKKSTDRLDEKTREWFALLGAFAPKPATFDLAAMKAVWQIDDPKPIARRLVERGLLEPVDGKFQMNALLVAHARSLRVSN
jgi:membrane protein implicated in regulation of membrane protease activity